MFKETEKLQLMDQVSLKQDPLVFLMTGLCVCETAQQTDAYKIPRNVPSDVKECASASS